MVCKINILSAHFALIKIYYFTEQNVFNGWNWLGKNLKLLDTVYMVGETNLFLLQLRQVQKNFSLKRNYTFNTVLIISTDKV